MDIDNFIASHRNKLQVDKDNLTLNYSPDQEMDNKDINYISKSKIEKSAKTFNAINEKHQQCYNKNANMDFLQKNNIDVIDPTTSAGAGVQQLQSQTKTTENMCMSSPSMATTPPMHNQQNTPHPNVVEQNNFQNNENLGHDYCRKRNGNALVKKAKNLANLNERQCADIAVGSQNQENKDDMEQWVSDTFYSYFPGYNNENKRRQEILHDRQLEYQQNFIKHQMNEANANSGKKKHAHSHLQEENTQQNFCTDGNHKQITTSRSSDKTDLEIIVNNPDYEGKSPRPGSARHKLLQDLKHTEISNIVNNDGVTERNRRNAEMEMVKKKDYQKELLAQIEEKRRSIEVLKEKERRQEEALTRKLQEQLKTMHLQEELEKEKMRADKVRFDSEQNRLMREHLLTKLENDAKLLSSAQKSRSENEKITPDENKVYKYFSNSARHEFRREAAHEPPAFHLDVPPSAASFCRKKCFHEIKDNIMCPFCDSTLKSYESWCLKCERKIFENAETDLRLLVCENCKKLYSVCSYCDKNGANNCSHCQRNQNCCANCRKTLCSDCIYAISLGKNSKQKTDSERSFEILEVNYPEDEDEDKPTSNPNDLNNNYERNRPPYSMNIDRNSIFHHDFDRSKLYNDENNIEVIRHETDKRLSRYFKNYGDLACKGLRDRSTQTTPDSALRRDIVMVEENNLSMPLLREMPRMTRKESNLQQAERRKKGTRIENLARRWEVPAVQKHTITTNSPKVLTQLGAIRKQLQTEQLHLDFNENK